MSEWKEFEFSKLLVDESISYGIVQPGDHTENNSVPIIRVQNIKNGYIYTDNLLKVSSEIEDKYRRTRLLGGELLITVVGSIGECAIVPKSLKGLNVARAISVARIKNEFDTRFVKYCFKTEDVKFQLYGNTNDTVQPTLNLSLLKNIKINIPYLDEQEAIAEVLSSLDDKIDLLRLNNKTLEELAGTIFQERITSRVEQKGKLKEYITTANTGLDAIKRAPIVAVETGVKCLRIQDVSQIKSFIRWGNTKVEPHNFIKFQLKKHDIIMARTCTPGINYLVREDLQAVFNNGLLRIRANTEKVHPLLLYYLFKTRDFIGHIDSISGGTSVQLNMQVGDLLDYDVSFPSKKDQTTIVETLISFDDRIHANLKQIAQLEIMRDTLLLKLMSGALRVNILNPD